VLALDHPGVLRLLEVRAHQRRVAWVYEPWDGLALGALPGAETTLPARAAAEIVAEVATTLLEIGAELRHPGPEVGDVLVDARGGVRLAGFVGPYRRPLGLRAPFGDRGEAAQVYRLGLLLAHLLTGALPGPAVGEEAHAAVLRNVLIRSMARPGDVLPERLADWLRGMLAWSPVERPVLSAIPDGLRDAVGGARPSLVEWAARHVDALRQRAADEAQAVRDALPPVVELEDSLDEVSQDSLASPLGEREEPYDDEPTQEAPIAPVPGHELAPRTLPPSAIPVSVGPPAEVLKRRPRLPEGFLEAGTDETMPVEGPPSAARLPAWALFALSAAGLAAIAVAATALLLLQGGRPPAAPAHEPSIAEALGPGPADPGAFDVVFAARGGEPFAVRCAGGATAEGVDEVVVRGALAGPCTVRGVLDGAPVEVQVEVTGPGTIRCFQTRTAHCH
jgi:hypothetical protein